jgi:glutamyl-tRNA reductase
VTAAAAVDLLRGLAESIRAAELARLRTKLDTLTLEERQAVEGVTAHIVERLLDEPAARLAEPAGAGLVPVLCELFALEETA